MRRSLRASLVLVAASACSPTPPPPPVAAVSAPSASAPLAAEAEAPFSATPVSVFAEGWDVVPGDTSGPMVVYDQAMSAAIAVDGVRLSRVEEPFYGASRRAGATRQLVGGWPEGAVLVARGPLRDVELLVRRKHRWDSVRHDRFFNVENRFLDPVRGPGGKTWLLSSIPVTLSGQGLFEVYSLPEGEPIGETLILDVDQLAAHPDGSIIMLGVERGFTPRWILERRRPGDRTSSITPVLTTAPFDDVSLRACGAPDGAAHVIEHNFKTSRSTLLTLRRGQWQVVPIPGTRRMVTPEPCAVGSDGAVWFVLAKDVFRVAPSGVVERIALPALPPLQSLPRFVQRQDRHWRVEVQPLPADQLPRGKAYPTGVRMADDGSVWISVQHHVNGQTVTIVDIDELRTSRTAVLRVGPPLMGTPIAWDGLAPDALSDRLAVYDALGGSDMSEPLVSRPVTGPRSCAAFFARLVNMPETPPATPAHERVRHAISGHGRALTGVHFVEARVFGEHVLGALVPNYGVGKYLVSLVKERQARLYCGRPDVIRVAPLGIANHGARGGGSGPAE